MTNKPKWAIVPVEPTDGMLDEINLPDGYDVDLLEYGYMLAAAPPAPAIVEALEVIAGHRQCIDNLMSDKDVARAALAQWRGRDE